MKLKKNAAPDPEYTSIAGRLMAEARWKGKTEAERNAELRRMGKKGGKEGGGRPRSEKRCFCGAFTMQRACSRNFDCCRKAGVLILNLPKKELTPVA